MLKVGLACTFLALCLLPYSWRLLQSPTVRQLEQPTQRFLQQIGVRARVDVLQVSPLHLLVTTNCNSSSQEALARQLRFLYKIDESRGDQLLVVHANLSPTMRDQPWVLLLLSTGVLLVGCSTCLALLRWSARPVYSGLPRKRIWQARLFKLAFPLTIWAVATAALPPLCLPLYLLFLLWWKVRQRAARQRPIVNGTQEAAILLMSFTPEFAAQCFKELGPDTVHAITLEISRLPQISPDMREAVMATFEGHMARAWSGANRDNCTAAMVFATLDRFYLNSGLRGKLAAGAGPRVRLSVRRTLALMGSGGILGFSLVPTALLGFWSGHAQPLEVELKHFVRLQPLAAVQIERDGETRYLVGLGTPDLGSLRPFVAERAQALGLDPLSVGCVGVNRRRHFPFWLGTSLVCGGLGLLLWKRRSRQPAPAVPTPTPAPLMAAPVPVVQTPPAPAASVEVAKVTETKKPDSVINLMQVDEVSFEVSRSLLSLVDPNQGARLLERVTGIRRQIAMECGFVVPGVRFRDNLALAANEYVIRIRGVEMGRGVVLLNHVLAIGPPEKLAQLEGKPANEPTFGAEGLWIESQRLAQGERLGLIMLDPVSVIATQLTTLLRENAAEILTFSACMDLLKHPGLSPLLTEVESRGFDKITLWKLLREMLRQQVSIRDLTRILEGLLLSGFEGATLEELVELSRLAVRDSIARELCEVGAGKAPGPMVVWRVAEELLDMLDQGPQHDCELLDKFLLLSQRMLNAGHKPVVLVEPVYRPGLQKLLLPLRNLRVLSTAELPEWAQISFFRGEGNL
ncbi:MAG: FHIPEP family type III secretion protein [Vulcanimicrobiota bacterium]